MQLKRMVVAAMAAGGALADESICDKYTIALLKNNTGANQYTLLSLLVNTAVIGNYTGPGTKNPKLPGSMVNVPGILAPGMIDGQQVNLAPYFNGMLASSPGPGNMAVATNWLDGGGADPIIANATSPGNSGSNQARLLSHLYQYFGAALGCSQYGKMGFPSYMGYTSMGKVHQYMDLNAAQVNYFIEQVGLAASSFGASSSDVTAVANLLNSTFNYKCSPPAAVLPGAPKEIQAICLDSTCPLSPNATCSAYPAVMSPKLVSGSNSTMSGVAGASGSMASATGSMASATGSMASGMSGSSTASGTAAHSTGAASLNKVNAAFLALAGLFGVAAM